MPPYKRQTPSGQLSVPGLRNKKAAEDRRPRAFPRNYYGFFGVVAPAGFVAEAAGLVAAGPAADGAADGKSTL